MKDGYSYKSTTIAAIVECLDGITEISY